MKKKCFWLSVFILGILSFIYIIKGIFPFGNESIIWSDMHEQITAIYYHFYDAIRGNSSLLVDFTSGGGVNFVGILAYYILSPFIPLCFSKHPNTHTFCINRFCNNFGQLCGFCSE